MTIAIEIAQSPCAHRGTVMKFTRLNKYTTAAIMFIAAAVILVIIAVRTNLGEFVTATFVLSGMICVMTAIFILTFSQGEPIDPRFVGFLPVQGCINLCRIGYDLGITGNAYFLPPRVTGEAKVMQFNPTLPYKGDGVSAKESFPKTGPAGVVTVPSCDPLIQDLRKRNALVIPDNKEQLIQVLRETTGEIFEFAPRVSIRWNGSTVTITFHHYRFIAGCEFIAQESPGCCARNPCPACSLCGALIAEGTDKVVTLDQCSVSSSSQDVNAVFSLIS
jgi:hypothetical protein